MTEEKMGSQSLSETYRDAAGMTGAAEHVDGVFDDRLEVKSHVDAILENDAEPEVEEAPVDPDAEPTPEPDPAAVVEPQPGADEDGFGGDAPAPAEVTPGYTGTDENGAVIDDAPAPVEN